MVRVNCRFAAWFEFSRELPDSELAVTSAKITRLIFACGLGPIGATVANRAILKRPKRG